jgi:sirohydrochlorin ferrochelatase
MTTKPALILTAHGSADRGHAAVVESLAARVRLLQPSVTVTVSYLGHDNPRLPEVATPAAVVVPLMLGGGYHVLTDIPQQAPRCVIARPLGPDPRLAQVLAERLDAAGWTSGRPVVLAASGSTGAAARHDARAAARALSALLGTDVRTAFHSGGKPRLAELVASSDAAIATYLLAPGHFATAATTVGASVVSAPLGDHPLLAEVIVDRYADALTAAAQPAGVPSGPAVPRLPVHPEPIRVKMGA